MEMSELTYGQKSHVWQWSTRGVPVGYYQSVGVAAGCCADRRACKSRVALEDAQQFAELWAAKFCRQMALAARVMRTLEHGRVPRDGILAIAKLIPKDEPNAPRHIEDLGGAARAIPGDRPPKAFWRALWKIHRVCGFDTPSPGRLSNRHHLIVHTASGTELIGSCEANWWLSSSPPSPSSEATLDCACLRIAAARAGEQTSDPPRHGIRDRRSLPRTYIGARGAQ
jgi:hypothetical protein